MLFLYALTAFASPDPPPLAVPPVEVPIQTLVETLPLPDGLSMDQALGSVGDIATIFALYEPAIPRIPGVSIDLTKEVISMGLPTVLDLPVSGNAIGKRINERARVVATSDEALCPSGIGRRITLDFGTSTYNIGRRIDRIEITACPETTEQGVAQIRATGRLYEGYKPMDPSLNPISEAIGSRAFQGAFLKQVPPILTALRRHWDNVNL